MASEIQKRNTAIIILAVLLDLAIVAIIVVIVTKPKTTTTTTTVTDCSGCSSSGSNVNCTSSSCTSTCASNTCLNCNGPNVNCTSSSCTIQYPTNTVNANFQTSINKGGYSIPTFIVNISDTTQTCSSSGNPTSVCNSVLSIQNVLPQVQKYYPSANVATIDDLTTMSKNQNIDQSFKTLGALFDYNKVGSSNNTMPVGYPLPQGVSDWPGQGVNQVWIRIPTFDPWSTVRQNLQSMSGTNVNVNAVYLLL